MNASTHLPVLHAASEPESPSLGEPTLIVGAGDGGRFLAQQMLGDRGCGFHPVGFVDDNHHLHGARVAGLPVLGATTDLPEIARREGVRAVVIAIPSASKMLINRIGRLGRRAGARVLAMPPPRRVAAG